MTPDLIRVLIADDHPIVRGGLAGLISGCARLQLVGAAADGAEAIRRYAELRPDVVLMDLRMPGVDGVAAIEAIRAHDPQARVVILTTFDGEEDIWRGLRAGARGYLLKDSPPADILAGIETVMRGQRCLPGPVAAKLASRMEGEALSRRETEVLRHLAQGLSNKEIARATGITEGTVKFHVTAVMAKLGAKSRTEAVTQAVRRGLVRLEG